MVEGLPGNSRQLIGHAQPRRRRLIGIDADMRGHGRQHDLRGLARPLTLPKLNLARRPPSIFDYTFEDFQIVNYQHHPAIKAPVAV